MRRRLVLALVLLLSVTLLPSASGATQSADPAAVGRFSAPFQEPLDGEPSGAYPYCTEGEDGTFACNPAAGTLNVLTDGSLLYFNALEGTENVTMSIVAEFGIDSISDQTRRMVLRGPGDASWTEPLPERADVLPPDETEPLIPLGPLNNAEDPASNHNDQALFCADVNMLPDGRILAAGGTNYYNEPSIPGTDFGVVELEGLNETRLYDPATNTWTQGPSMEHGRWYPTLVTLPDGDQFVASGVRKLIKPVYLERDPLESGRNVVQPELLDTEAMAWQGFDESANRSLPLFPRLHLLPNGEVFYNAAGQTFNPNGFAYDEALWNIAASFDPGSQTWTDLGIPGLGTLSTGFRGSSFSVMMPLRPDDQGDYTSASFLSAGGVLGTSPGLYLAVPTSLLTTVDTSGDSAVMTSEETGYLNNARWYSTGVALPTGEVIAFSGANRDEVVAPGTGNPIMTPEIFSPDTGEWTELAPQQKGRTYHNTAVLLPDGRVLVGGHAPISTLYGPTLTIPGGFSEQGRDPSFEIFEPPYLFRGDRPEIDDAPESADPGDDLDIELDGDRDIDSVVLVRLATLTHLVDADQRTVELDFDQDGDELTATVPNAEVVPPGQYMLFVNGAHEAGPVPSESAIIQIG